MNKARSALNRGSSFIIMHVELERVLKGDLQRLNFSYPMDTRQLLNEGSNAIIRALTHKDPSEVIPEQVLPTPRPRLEPPDPTKIEYYPGDIPVIGSGLGQRSTIMM